MNDVANHPIMSAELEDGILTTPVALDVVRSGLASDDNRIRSQAARVAAGLARVDRDRATALAPSLWTTVADDHRVVVHRSAAALARVAEARPGRLEPAVDTLVELLAHDVPDVRTLAARGLAFLALERPAALAGHVDALVAATAAEPEHLIDPDQIAATDYDDQARTLHLIDADHVTEQVVAREIAANLLVEVAEHHPDAVRPHVTRLAGLLGDDDTGVVTAVADVLGSIAEDDPGSISDAVAPLCDLLDHADEGLVATVVATLGFADDPDAVEDLRRLAADEERSEDLRAFATETADVLEAGGTQ